MRNFNLQDKSIALVHDYLYTYGGAERVMEVIHDIFPKSPVYTSYFIKDKFPKQFEAFNIKESFLGKISLKNTWLRKFFTLFIPFAFETMNLSKYDIIISDSAGPAKGVNSSKNSFHISYIHTPPWFEWGIAKARLRRRIYLPLLKAWDKRAAKKPNILLANSTTVADRIKTFYKRDSIILHPPVEIEKLRSYVKNTSEKEDYYLMCSRLDMYKGVSTVAKILVKNGKSMKIIGRGDDEKNLINLPSNIEYLGFVDDQKKAEVFAKAKALIVWNEEDFGITMVEAIALGTPVIALNKGGALDILEDMENGVLFDDQTEDSLMQAIQKLDNNKFDSEFIKQSADKFSREEFERKFLDILNSEYSKFLA